MLNDVQNESFAEQLREKTRFYKENDYELDFFMVCEPAWLDEQHPEAAKKVGRPCVALVGTEENWIRCVQAGNKLSRTHELCPCLKVTSHYCACKQYFTLAPDLNAHCNATGSCSCHTGNTPPTCDNVTQASYPGESWRYGQEQPFDSIHRQVSSYLRVVRSHCLLLGMCSGT